MQGPIEDIQLIARPLWLLLMLQFFIAVSFLGFPQGIDVLYAFIEDFHKGVFYDTSIKIFTFLSALAFWTTVSEYGARLILFLSDLSSEKLDLVDRRRRSQYIKKTPFLLFHFPIVITICGFIYSFFTKTYRIKWAENEQVNLISLIIITSLLIIELIILRRLRYGFLNHKIFGAVLSWKAKRNLVQYKGLYNITNKDKMSFKAYAPFYNMFVTLFLISMFSILFWAFAPINLFEKTGAASFICMGFGSWIMIYTSIHFLSKRKIFGYSIPFKLLAIILLLLVSYTNNDHPIRQLNRTIKYRRPTIQEYFETWVINRNYLFKTDSVIQPIIICAEGGALRTGCFSAMLLAHIQEAFPQFKHQIFCYSAVSGGSLGVSFFNALNQRALQPRDYSQYTKKFFQYDFLAPVTGKLVFGEPINWFFPRHIEQFDRNIILERSWEMSWRELSSNAEYMWQEGFLSNYAHYKTMPALFINTTEVETGKRTIISNIQTPKHQFIGTVDFFEQIKKDIPYSTAVGLSARFPIISSAGAVNTICGRRHYLDGGYAENKGNETAIEIIKALPTTYRQKEVKPILIQISFSPIDTSCKRSTHFLSELNEIIATLEHIRNGRTLKANEELKMLIQNKQGIYLESSLEEKNIRVPMNWTLSRNAIARIELFCSKEVIRLQNDLQRIMN